MNLILFVVAMVISFGVVRIGAVAFHLTGIEWSQAKFQALSCFSGTGFTTRESELIVSHSQRRRIATVLMILGNAGIVTLIATFANSISADGLAERIRFPFLDLIFPAYLIPIVNLAVIILAVIIVFKIFTSNTISRRLTSSFKNYLVKKQLVRTASFEELLVTTGKHGVASMEINDDSPLCGTTLLTSGLRAEDITVLAIEHNGETTPNPVASSRIQSGDRLICYGNLENIRKLSGDVQEESSKDSMQP